MSDDGYGLQPPEPQAPAEVQTRGVVSVSAAELRGNGDGVMATVRSAHGGPINERNPIRSDSIVSAGGMDMRIEQAVQLGYLERDGDGYRNVPPKEAQAEQPSPTPDAISPDVIQAHNELAEMVPAPMLDAAVSRMLDGQPVSLEGEAGTKAQKVVNALHAQAARRFASQNVDPEAFGNWASENAKRELRAAQIRHYATGDARVYDALVSRYLAKVPPNNDAIKAAGIETLVGGRGEQLVKINGYTMTAKAAARAGLI